MDRDREMDLFEVAMKTQVKGEFLMDRPLCQDRHRLRLRLLPIGCLVGNSDRDPADREHHRALS